MPILSDKLPQRRVQIIFGLILALILYAHFELREENKVIVRPHSAIVLAQPVVTADPFEKLLRTDPLEALKVARERVIRKISDYECTLVKQERLPSGMSPEQEVNVLFRQEPYSVMMHWVRNAGLAGRVIYVKDRWIDEDAKHPEERQLAVCQPSAAVAKLLVNSIKQPIRGYMAERSGRRSIDEFGFKRTLDLLIKYCDIARENGELVLEFKGETRFNGRPVWVVRRHLPFPEKQNIYPDCIAQIFIDQEYQVPVAVYCYADEACRPDDLLGKYEYRNIRFGLGLSETHFDPVTYGM